MQVAADLSASEDFGQLFFSLAEGLKMPMLRIARQAELLATEDMRELRVMQLNADIATQLLDGYLLSLRLLREPQTVFETRPVSVGAVLYETRTRLQAIAQEYGVELMLDIDGRYEPVLANTHALTSALFSLGCSVIEALPALDGRQQLHLSAHRTREGIVMGMYFEANLLKPASLRRAQKLQGKARQPFVNEMPNSGAGVFVADSIFRALQTQLHIGRHRKLPGFAVTLTPSRQLQLV